MTAEQIIKKLTVLRGQQAKIDSEVSLIVMALEDGEFEKTLEWLNGDRSILLRVAVDEFRKELKEKKLSIPRPRKQAKQLGNKQRSLPNY